MSRAPAITVGISFLDEEETLGVAVRSILGQTMVDLELLLVDDGSRDRSLEIARSFADPRVRVISDGLHRGLAARLNEIAGHARAELVARMDADDVSHPLRLERELACLREAGVDAVGTWAGLFDDELGVFGVIESGALPPTAASVLETGLLPHATMLARRDWLRRNRYDESLLRAEDLDLWCRTAATSSFAVVREPLYAIRVLPNAAGFAAAYAYAQRLNRQLLRRHGPGAIGPVRTARACAVSLAKSGVVRAAALAGVTARVVRRRGRRPSDAERSMIEEALRSAGVAPHGVTDLLERDVRR